ncbi:MAG TPA: chromosome segregation protein SMC [Fimbriimonadaceae bacterium]|nr:chromosome segregation protein SMC [Fimbriimonadaceae bacterium]
MRLKRVRIFGFKTFADRTEVNLDGGIIAVVGPNGCGKSNLVDAILWALGESNARHLRATAGPDVIFSGSARRKPVGFAEVTLFFDNEDAALPIDAPEVTVTRRLTRSGESEYFINRRSCRQRDIHELLADSGLGRAGYAIVGQKEIDQALAASPEDRRAWVDEAAGVQRYRARKVESMKRLSSARDHLVRVEDILRELDSQREPLREEAEVARKYRAATAALREVETGVLILDLAKSSREVLEHETRLAASAEIVKSESQKAERLEEGAKALRGQVLDVEHEMEGVRTNLQEALTAMERSDAAARLGEERLRSLDELETTLKSGEGDLHVAEAEAELESLKKEEQLEEEALARARVEVGGVGAEAKLVAERLREAETRLAEARVAHAARLKQQADQEHRAQRRALAERELEGIERDLPGLSEAREEASKQAEAALRAFSSAEADLKKTEAALIELRGQEDALGAKARGFLAERAALEGRRRGIEATIQAHEGLAQGSRAVLEAVERGDLTASYTPVGEAIQTKKEHAVAIETALGAAANDLIVEHESDAKAAIRLLKERRLGRATFQPVTLMRPGEISGELRRLESQPHVVGRASELVQCDPRYRSVIESLLGRILVVEDLDASLRMAKSHGWSRIVTLDGEVVHASGAVSGGQAAKAHYGLVQRQADLRQVGQELGRIEKEIAASEKAMAEAGLSRQTLLAGTAAAKEDLDRTRQDLDEARDYLHALNAELQAAGKSTEKLVRELEQLSVSVAMADEVDVEGLQAERDAMMNELAGRSADANQAKERLAAIEFRLQQARNRAVSVAKRLEAARHSQSQRAAKLQNLEPERHRVRADIAKSRTELEQAEKRKRRAEDDLRALQAKKDGLLEESLRVGEEIKAVRANLAAMADANHQGELGRARAEAKRATAAERLLEEYGIDAEEAVDRAGTIVVPPDAQPVANRLRREIRAMGNVNIGAIEAYERLATRFEELNAQRADIVEGIEQVEASMGELDKLTRDRFLDTFHKVEVAYAEMFQKLFAGGEGKISLDQPNSILDSGIEIEVTLPGKKRQRLELLSGGERALCAAGFLFALLKVKPSPLVVLDEVDAPLDGRNVERFGDLLVEFTDRTQFIVITHNPTTIERAPVWLGVTMQEPGVSTLVPARLPNAAVVVEPRPMPLRLSPAAG